MISPGAFLLILGLIIYIGVVGSYVFERYRIPDVLNLILLGVLLGPVLHLVNPALLTPWMPHVGALALGLILFEGGLDLDIDHILSRFWQAFLLGTATFALSSFSIAFAYRLLTGAGWLQGALLGAVLGCVSSAIILPVTSYLSAPEKVRTTLNLEAVLSDLWGVVVTLVLIRVAGLPTFDPGHAVNAVAGAYSTAIVSAVVFGLAWLWALDRLKKSPFAYMMTLAAVFVLYGLIELVHGSGPMAALTFGVVLTNADKIMEIFGRSFRFELDDKIRAFNTEATFFARTFFFFYLGLVITLQSFDLDFFKVVLTVFVLVVLSRFAVVWGESRLRGETTHAAVFLAMIPRGLTSAVLAAMAWGAGIPGTERFLEYTFAVILLTNALMTWALYRIERPAAPPAREGAGA